MYQNIARSIDRFKEIGLVFNAAIEEIKKKLITIKGEERHIPVLKLMKQPGYSTILFEIIKEYNFTPPQLNSVLQLLQSETGKYVRSSTHNIFRNRNWLIIAPGDSALAENILIENVDEAVVFNGGLSTLKLQVIQPQTDPLSKNNFEACIDLSLVSYPLLLRRWKAGDYFYPLGMNKKKKINRFLIDQKLSITEKEKVYVIEMEKKIFWIVGYRIDDRFKIKPSTQQWLKLSVS